MPSHMHMLSPKNQSLVCNIMCWQSGRTLHSARKTAHNLYAHEKLQPFLHACLQRHVPRA